jgi:hypothetical protein
MRACCCGSPKIAVLFWTGKPASQRRGRPSHRKEGLLAPANFLIAAWRVSKGTARCHSNPCPGRCCPVLRCHGESGATRGSFRLRPVPQLRVCDAACSRTCTAPLCRLGASELRPRRVTLGLRHEEDARLGRHACQVGVLVLLTDAPLDVVQGCMPCRAPSRPRTWVQVLKAGLARPCALGTRRPRTADRSARERTDRTGDERLSSSTRSA